MLICIVFFAVGSALAGVSQTMVSSMRYWCLAFSFSVNDDCCPRYVYWLRGIIQTSDRIILAIQGLAFPHFFETG
jgi:hypothetical protein